MDDDKLKSLFSDFEPQLSSEAQFMSKLRQNLNSVEIVKRHTAEVRSNNRKAMAMAAFIGFIVGFLTSLSLPWLCDVVSKWQLTLPSESLLNTLANHFSIIAWTAIGATSVFAALNTYGLSLSLLQSRK